MANTQSLSALQAQLWYKELFADMQDYTFMSKLSGSGPNNAIQIVEDLRKQPGDTINFGLSVKLAGTGVTGDDELEGNEEAITTYQEALKIDQLRHAVRLKGKMDEKKVAYSMRSDAKEKLAIWYAERWDQEIIDKLCGLTTSTFANVPDAPATSRRVWAGGQTDSNNLTAAMKFDTKVIDRAKQLALLASPKVRPIRMKEGAYKGQALFICIVHPYQGADLRNDPVWNQSQRDANVRGEGNPIFDGALGIYNNVIIYQHEGIYTWTNTSQIPCARAVLLGQQAAVIGVGADMEWVEKEFDYGNKVGFSVGRIFGVIKPLFNSVDYGVVSIDTAATALTTA